MFRYEDKGLFIALVSYPFYMNGKLLSTKVFEQFFKDHRDEYLKKFISESQSYDANLYEPTCYRLIGSQGLAVLSLIDDYAFASRVFNLAHINADSKVDYENATKCQTVVITTSSEVEEGKECTEGLEQKAKSTFRSQGEQYPFVGILRLKINCMFLDGRGLELIHSIKDKFKNSFKEGLNLEYIVTDSYDCDELIVSVFSRSLYDINVFVDRVKHLKINDLYDISGTLKEVHVFQACHLNFGYHPDFSFKYDTNGTEEAPAIETRKSETEEAPVIETKKSEGSVSFYEWEHDKDKGFSINLLMEPRCGHETLLFDFITKSSDSDEKYSFLKNPVRTVSGGGLMHFTVPIENITSLYDFTEVVELRRHVRRAKLTLSSEFSKDSKDKNTTDDSYFGNDDIITREKADELKACLLRSRVSKTIRERTMALVHRYNDLGRSSIQYYYFKQLKPAIESLTQIVLSYVKNGEPILRLEQTLDEELSSLENAINDRISNNLSSNSVLEYGCGIQQLLHAFGFAYQKIFGFLNPCCSVIPYSFITGMCKESSTRTHVELNINHIIYPQNFVATVWKEASNYAFDAFREVRPTKDEEDNNHDAAAIQLQIFYRFTQDRRFVERILQQFIYEWSNDKYDVVYNVICQLIQDRSLNIAKYLFSDCLVWHYAFADDFELMWRSNFKVFLQTSTVYYAEDYILMKPFVFLLLRMFLVAHIIEEHQPNLGKTVKGFLNREAHNPFSHVLSDLWFSCFDKIRTTAKAIFNEIKDSGFEDSLFRIVNLDYINYKSVSSDKIKNIIVNHGEIVNSSGNVLLDIKSLFLGFVKAVDELSEGKESKDTLPSPDLHTAVRSEKGMLDYNYKGQKRILPDPVGGYSIFDPDKRKEYFAYRTCFYRTLWHYSFVSQQKYV